MNDRQRRALDRTVQEAQDRSRRNWNRMVEATESEVQSRRDQFHIVHED